jgi:predicted MFS family arabinose efflux permease
VRNFRLFLLYRVLTRLLLFAPYIQLFITKVRGLSQAEYGLLQGLYYLVVVAAEVPTGVLADRFGRKAILVVGALVNGLGCFLFAVATDFPVFAAGEVLFGLGTAFVSGADSALLYDSLAAERQEAQYPRAEGAAQASWLLATVALYPLSDRLLVVDGNPVLAYWIAGGLSIAGAAVGLHFTEPPRGERQSAVEITLGAIRDVATLPGVARVILYSIGVFALLRAAVVLFFHPVLEAQGVPPDLYGTILAGMNLAGAIAALRAHRWIARSERLVVLLVPGALLIMFLLLALLRLPAAAALFCVQGAAFGLYPPLTRLLLNRRVPSPRRRATILSLDSLACRLMFSPLAVFAGWALGSLGLAPAMAATALLACVPIVMIVTRRGPRGG